MLLNTIAPQYAFAPSSINPAFSAKRRTIVTPFQVKQTSYPHKALGPAITDRKLLKNLSEIDRILRHLQAKNRFAMPGIAVEKTNGVSVSDSAILYSRRFSGGRDLLAIRSGGSTIEVVISPRGANGHIHAVRRWRGRLPLPDGELIFSHNCGSGTCGPVTLNEEDLETMMRALKTATRRLLEQHPAPKPRKKLDLSKK